MENKVEWSEMSLSFFPDANSCQEYFTYNYVKHFVEILFDMLCQIAQCNMQQPFCLEQLGHFVLYFMIVYSANIDLLEI